MAESFRWSQLPAALAVTVATEIVVRLEDGTFARADVSLVGDLLGASFEPAGAVAAEQAARTAADADLQAQIDTKLDAADYVAHYKGKFVSLAALVAAIPAGADGDYAIINAGAGVDAQEAIWDTEEGWVLAAAAAPATTDEVAEGATNLYFTSQRVRDAVLAGLSLATNAAITAADSILTALGKLQAQITGIDTRVTALEAGGGGGGGGTISADTTINYPGAYANWAALIADLKSSVYTGTVTVNVAAGVYTHYFDFGTDLVMPNLHLVFDPAAQLDPTGLPPNFAIYNIAITGTRVTIGSISGTLTKVNGDAGVPVFAIGGNGFNVGFGTSDGLLPAAGGTMTDMSFVNFEAGVSFVNSILTGYGKLAMTGLITGQDMGFNGFGCFIRGVELEMDGDLVKVGGALTSNIADGSPCGSFRAITFTGTRGVPRCAVVWEGMVDLGLVSNTGTDEWYVAATTNGTGSARIAANSVFDQVTGTNAFWSILGASLQVTLQGDITWKPATVNSRLSGGDGHLDISAYGSGNVTIDNSGGVTPDFVFAHQYGAVKNVDVGGNYGFVHQFGANKPSGGVSLVWNSSVTPTQVSYAETGSSVNIDPSASIFYHQALSGALIADLNLDLGYLAADQEFTLLSYYGVTSLTFSQVVTNAPAGLAANTPVRLKKMNGNWYAI